MCSWTSTLGLLLVTVTDQVVGAGGGAEGWEHYNAVQPTTMHHIVRTKNSFKHNNQSFLLYRSLAYLSVKKKENELSIQLIIESLMFCVNSKRAIQSQYFTRDICFIFYSPFLLYFPMVNLSVALHVPEGLAVR